MTRAHIPHSQRLLSSLVILLTGLAFFSAVETSSAHGYPPTATPSPTLPPPEPELFACQVAELIFDRDTYLTGETIGVTIRVVDDQDEPLVGANVWVEVDRQPLSAQQSTEIDSIDLEDRSGYYNGFYDLTDLPGQYGFTFTVNDPTGERFLPCSAQGAVSVETPTPTPTFTPTVTPTPTPTFTPTPPPIDTVVQVVPELLTTTLCSLRDVTVINVAQAANLAGVELEISYDPDVIQVIDADRSQRGVQVRLDPVFNTGAINQNSVDTGNGRIYFAADLLSGQTIAGNQNLIAIDWRPQNVGNTPITLERVILRDAAGQPLEFEARSGAAVVDFVTNCAVGAVALQQRADYGDVLVTNGAGQQTRTLPDGAFGIAASGPLGFTYPGFLSAQTDLPPEMAGEQLQEGQMTTIEVDTVTLLAGDINGDDLVNILDLAYVAGHYQTPDPAADLNGDGTVNIFDLVLVAGNYQLRGPLNAAE